MVNITLNLVKLDIHDSISDHKVSNSIIVAQCLQIKNTTKNEMDKIKIVNLMKFISWSLMNR
jgi:hypothetical protein